MKIPYECPTLSFLNSSKNSEGKQFQFRIEGSCAFLVGENTCGAVHSVEMSLGMINAGMS